MVKHRTVPVGYISLIELAELAEKSKYVIRRRLYKAGIPEKRITVSGTRGRGSGGGHPMYIYPHREALYAALDDTYARNRKYILKPLVNFD